MPALLPVFIKESFMNTTTEPVLTKKQILRQTAVALITVVLIAVSSILVFMSIYNTYIDKVLYAERLSQMKEVTTQLFSGLEDIVTTQWQTTRTQRNYLALNNPETLTELQLFMQEQTTVNEMSGNQTSLIAVDSLGRYYTQQGLQGSVMDMDYLLDTPERVSFVSNSLTTGETRMVFLYRLDRPITIANGDKTITLTYYGTSRSMTQLNPYFDCKAYDNHNSVYVVDQNGLKLFNSSSEDLLKGYNAYTVLSKMNYLHGSSYQQAADDLARDGVAYSNAVLDGSEYYYALYHMKNTEWTLVFLVPSQVVAINTSYLIHTTVNMVLLFAFTVAALCACTIIIVMHRQQHHMLALSEQSNAQLSQINAELDEKNERLARAMNTAEEALQTANSANSAKSEFLSSMSHDIRTPMNAIMGITTLMEGSLNDPEKLQMYLNKLRAAGEHLLGLINDVLDMSKIESGKTHLNIEQMNLAEQVARITELVHPQIQAHGHHFEVCTEGVRHENLYGDQMRLRQVLVNVLSNAIKYTRNGGDISFTIREIPRDGLYARYDFIVKDNGIGMSEDFQKVIFDSFSRAESTLTNRVQGSGLGMAITKSIVDLMGGTIRIDSELGKGSTFTITLDFKIDAEHDESVEKLNVLVINYSGIMLNRIMDATSRVPVHVTSVHTLNDAVAYLQNNKADVVLSHYRKGDPEKPHKVQRLRAASATPVIIIGMAEAPAEEVLDSVKADGLDGYITLPFFMSTLVHEVQRVRKAHSETDTAESKNILQGMKFLCAEDNALNAEILSAMLEMAGASCTICGNGQEVCEAFETSLPGEYDLILMDIQMPIMNGLQAARAIRNSANPAGKTIPIIAMTANAFSDDIQRSLDAGMNAHLSKPIDMKLVEQTVREFVVSRSTPKQS